MLGCPGGRDAGPASKDLPTSSSTADRDRNAQATDEEQGDACGSTKRVPANSQTHGAKSQR